DLLGQLMGVVAHDRTESLAAAAELRSRSRAVAGAAGALLLVDLLAGAVDLRAALGLVGPGAALGELVADHAGEQVGARLEAEHGLRQLDRTGRLALESGDIEFHHAFSSAWAAG